MELGLQADQVNARRPMSADELHRRRRTSRLSLVIDELRRVLTSVADASLFLMVVTDADGVVLWREGSPRVQLTADRLGFLEGMVWTEQVVGTNAIGTALAEAAPVQLFSAEHYESQQHPWYCTAAPVHDPRDGELLGVVDVSGPALTLHPAIGALVESAVRLAEASMWRQHQERLEALRRSTESVVSTTSGPLLVVDDHGWVAHHSGIAARDRIDVPRGRPGHRRAGPRALPARAARRPAGWSARTTARPRSARSSTAAPLEVHADGGSWRVVLTPRHAEIMRLLAAAGPRRAHRRLAQHPAVRRRRAPGHRARRGVPAAARRRRAGLHQPLPARRRRDAPAVGLVGANRSGFGTMSPWGRRHWCSSS